MHQQNDQVLLVLENKSVFPVVSEERRINYTYYDDYQYLDSKIQPITVAEYRSLVKSGYTVPQNVNEGTVLMRHPYRPNTLVDSNYDQLSYIQEKFSDYAVILNYLGATKQDLKAKITKHQTRIIEAKGKISSKAKFSLKGAFKRLTRDKFEVCYSLNIGATSGMKYKAAVDYAQQVGLLSDPFIRMVLEMQKEKPVDTIRTDLVISKDFSDIMDATATLQVMGDAFKLDGDFRKRVSSKDEISICQDLRFKEVVS